DDNATLLDIDRTGLLEEVRRARLAQQQQQQPLIVPIAPQTSRDPISTGEHHVPVVTDVSWPSGQVPPRGAAAPDPRTSVRPDAGAPSALDPAERGAPTGRLTPQADGPVPLEDPRRVVVNERSLDEVIMGYLSEDIIPEE
ncbi:hypothetical protein L6R52_38385, partial [Myxococcota bacterium]|nr:hypothetical protein [Myxococcota bacterium]